MKPKNCPDAPLVLLHELCSAIACTAAFELHMVVRIHDGVRSESTHVNGIAMAYAELCTARVRHGLNCAVPWLMRRLTPPSDSWS